MSDVSDSVTFNYSLSEQERQYGPCIHLHTKDFNWATRIAAALYPLAWVLIVFLMRYSLIPVVWFIVLFKALLSGSLNFIVSFMTASDQDQIVPATPETIEMIAGTADAEGIVLSSKSGEKAIAWASIVTATETPRYFLLYETYDYYGTSTYYKIPKRSFVGKGVLESFRQFVRIGIPEARLLAPTTSQTR